MKKLIFLVTCAFSGILYSQNNLDISESYVSNVLPFKQGKELDNFESDEHYHDYEEQNNFEVDDSEQPTLHEEQNKFEYPDKDNLEYSGPENFELPDKEDYFDTNEGYFQDRSTSEVNEN